jgi:hypothetical protein
VHEGGFDCAKNAEGKVEFRNQDGILLGTKLSNMPRYRGNVVAELNYKLEDRHIHAQTCVSRWDGERMDLGLAVSGLWDLNHSTGDASDRFAQ